MSTLEPPNSHAECPPARGFGIRTVTPASGPPCPGCGEDASAGESYGGLRWCVDCLDLDLHLADPDDLAEWTE